MDKLILLYFGTIILAWLSQVYYPVKADGLENTRHFLHRKSDVFVIIIFMWMGCFSFLRNTYNDTENYIYDFLYQTDSLDQFLQETNFIKIGSNSLFLLYQTIIRSYTTDFHIFFFFPAMFNSIVVVKFYKRYSSNTVFSLLLFYSVGTYIMYIAAVKQSVAVAILLIALPYAIDRKYIKFYLLVFIAMLFHTHAFVFLVVPFFFGKPWGKVTWLLLAIVLVAMATYDITFGTFMNIALDMGINIVDWEVFDGHAIHPVRVIVYWIPAIFALIFRNRLFSDSTRENNLFANLSIGAALILTIGLRQGANLFARMAAYYEVVMGITLPWMITKVFKKQSANQIIGIAMVMYFGYFLYEFGVSKDFGRTYTAISIFDFLSGLLNS